MQTWTNLGWTAVFTDVWTLDSTHLMPFQCRLMKKWHPSWGHVAKKSWKMHFGHSQSAIWILGWGIFQSQFFSFEWFLWTFWTGFVSIFPDFPRIAIEIGLIFPLSDAQKSVSDPSMIYHSVVSHKRIVRTESLASWRSKKKGGCEKQQIVIIVHLVRINLCPKGTTGCVCFLWGST